MLNSEDIESSGGASLGGSCVSNVVYSNVSSSGIVCSGTSSLNKSYDINGSGGVSCSGVIKQTLVSYVNAIGGVVCSGDSFSNKLCHEYGSGGIVCSGTSQQSSFSYVSGSGGIVCSGTSQQSFFDYINATGGLKCGGQSRIEVRKYRIGRTYSNSGRSISGTILFDLLPQKETLMIPAYVISVENQLVSPRKEVTGVWCKVEDSCSEGAILPAIIPVNQKGFVPDPKGAVSARDRGFATSS